MTPQLTVGRMIERTHDMLQLEHIESTNGLDRVIENPDVSSPGLAVAGYVERRLGFAYGRQVEGHDTRTLGSMRP